VTFGRGCRIERLGFRAFWNTALETVSFPLAVRDLDSVRIHDTGVYSPFISLDGMFADSADLDGISPWDWKGRDGEKPIVYVDEIVGCCDSQAVISYTGCITYESYDNTNGTVP
jgi:hypothetical protein